MNYNYSANSTSFLLFILLFSFLQVAAKNNHNSVKPIEEIQQFIFENHEGKWEMKVQIAHHKMELKVKMGADKSWIKQSYCQICDKQGKNCQKDHSCFSSSKDPKIICDNAYCSKNDEYEGLNGVIGQEVQIFCKIGKSQQALMPIVFAKKIPYFLNQMGQFYLMDSSASFSHGLILVEQKIVRIINMNVKKDEKIEMKRTAFDSTQIPMNQNQLGFKLGTKLSVRNQISQKYSKIDILEPKGFTFNLVFDQLAISMPVRLLHELQRQIMAKYFPENSCRFNPGKIKCRDQLDFQGLTSAILQFQFQENSIISIPFHLLLGTCSSRQCKFLVTSHNKLNQIAVGTIIWQTIALQWNNEQKMMEIYRLNNNWASVYSDQLKNVKRQSFLANLLLVIFHIIKYIFIVLLSLAILSLFINCIFKWRDILLFIRAILIKIRGRGEPINENNEDEDFSVGTQGKRRRRMQRLPDQLDDEI